MSDANPFRGKTKTKGVLVLASGEVFFGNLFGHVQESFGEVVFNTSMMGYQEILTDPSYEGQMVAMTYPLVGNYGLNSGDFESRKSWVRGFIVRETCNFPSNWRSEFSLDEFLKTQNVAGIEGVDTRALTLCLRERGAAMGIISPEVDRLRELKEKASQLPGMVGQDLARKVSVEAPYFWEDKTFSESNGRPWKVVAFDFGIKQNILRKLAAVGCRVRVVPAGAGAEEVLAHKPDGIFLSNGPGDPAACRYAVRSVERLIGLKPIFGICLGHQILGLALGARTFKLKFGHHGANHPVKNLVSERVEITAQNHGFAVDPVSLKSAGLELTHINLNDQTVEGMRHTEYPIFSVQYHPEASPGPHDADYLFDEFIALMKKWQEK
jgi:carbamoyl-phosphate synthase small subunit